MHSSNSDQGDLSKEQSALIEKATDVLKAGGFHAETLSTIIAAFHRRLREELHQAESPAETGAGLEEEGPSTDVPRLAHVTINQVDRFRDALDHLEIIHEILMGNRNFSALSSLLLHPKEIFEELDREFDAAHEVIQAEEAEKRQASVC